MAEEIEQHRGGQIFDCVHSVTEAGCGKDASCEHCKIKGAIVDTFETANPHMNVSSELTVTKRGANQTYELQISTERVGALALVRIERFGPSMRR